MKKLIEINLSVPMVIVVISSMLGGCGANLKIFEKPRGTYNNAHTAIESTAESKAKTSSPPMAVPPVANSSSTIPPISNTEVLGSGIVSQSPVVESPVVESPVVESPVVESPVVESPVVESPVVESPVVESPVVESPVVESPATQISMMLRNIGSGHCLTVEDDSKSPGARGVQWSCNGERNQKFMIIKVGVNRFKVYSPFSRNYLSIAGGSLSDGASAVMWPNIETQNQVFSKVRAIVPGGFMLKAEHSGLCLSIENSSLDDGASVVQGPCWSGPNQTFLEENVENFSSDAPVRGASLINQGSRLCLTIENNSPAAGAFLNQWNCTGAINQRFEMIALGANYFTIRSSYFNNFVSIDGGTMDGLKLAFMWPENGLSNQIFKKIYYNGGFMLQAKYSGMCLSVEDGHNYNGAYIIQSSCKYSQNQIFEEYL